MKQIYPIGKMLHEYRTRKGVSQEQLCGTLIAVSTLSRIERGERMPDRKTAEYLFTRLGLAAPAGLVPMTKVEYERFCIEVQIRRNIGERDYEIKSLLERYRNLSKKMNILEEQFYKLYHAIYAYEKEGLSHEKTRELLIEAMLLSFENYSLNTDLTGHLLSETEIVTLNNIASETYFIGEKENAIMLMTFLKNYLQNPIFESEIKTALYSMILFNLCNWIGLEGRHLESLALAEEGISFDTTHGRLNYFPFHIFNKGYCLSMLGQKDDGKKYIDLAYRNFEVMGRHELVVQTASEVNRLFGFNFKED